MKKNLINRFTVIILTALSMFTTANTFAGKHHQMTNAANAIVGKHQQIATSTAKPVQEDIYMAYVQITTNMADTPYVSFSSPPEQVYANVIAALGRQTGLFHVHIVYMNKDSEIVSKEDYDIEN